MLLDRVGKGRQVVSQDMHNSFRPSSSSRRHRVALSVAAFATPLPCAKHAAFQSGTLCVAAIIERAKARELAGAIATFCRRRRRGRA